jgi:hypothetical protein
MIFPTFIFIFIVFVYLNTRDSDDDYAIVYETNCVKNFIVSEDGYRINVAHIRGFKTVETWPGKFVIRAYVTGGSFHPIKSCFDSRKKGNQWLDEFLKNNIEKTGK